MRGGEVNRRLQALETAAQHLKMRELYPCVAIEHDDGTWELRPDGRSGLTREEVNEVARKRTTIIVEPWRDRYIAKIDENGREF